MDSGVTTQGSVLFKFRVNMTSKEIKDFETTMDIIIICLAILLFIILWI
jgi:hypothetical protein